MENKNKVLGHLEQSIMDIVWEKNSPVKVSYVHSNLPEKKAYTSVMTVMNRLVKKGLLSREKNKNYYEYSPKKSKKNFASNKVKNMFKSVISSYQGLAIAEFVNAVSEDPESLRILKEYLDKDELQDTKKN